jgi:hypothetical protein
MLERLKEAVPGILTHVTYGAATKLSRKDLGLKKTHSNDAYAMGIFHPAHRTDAVCYEKRRRNNRVLEKFYDAVYVDIRTGKRAKGAQIGCNRTKRRESRTGSKNERIYRGKCLSKGRRSIRRKRYPIQSGDRIIFENKKYTSGGCQHYGEYVTLRGRKNAPSVNKVVVLYHAGGWVKQK